MTFPFVLLFMLTSCQANQDDGLEVAVSKEYRRYADHTWSVDVNSEDITDVGIISGGPIECGLRCSLMAGEKGCKSFIFKKSDGHCKILQSSLVQESTRTVGVGWNFYIEPPHEWMSLKTENLADVENFRAENAASKTKVGYMRTLKCMSATDNSRVEMEVATEENNIQLGLFFRFANVEEIERRGESCTLSEDISLEDSNFDGLKVLLDHRGDSNSDNPREETQNTIYKFVHPFSGNGIYTLVFDNTFSRVWSKEVFYRVRYFYD